MQTTRDGELNKEGASNSISSPQRWWWKKCHAKATIISSSDCILRQIPWFSNVFGTPNHLIPSRHDKQPRPKPCLSRGFIHIWDHTMGLFKIRGMWLLEPNRDRVWRITRLYVWVWLKNRLPQAFNPPVNHHDPYWMAIEGTDCCVPSLLKMCNLVPGMVGPWLGKACWIGG